jgi:hypothetical protein
MEVTLKPKPWYDYLEEDLRELLEQSFELIERVPEWHDGFHDYSFIVFPAAKAYEGYLKKLFLDLGFINQEAYYGKHFRIGKALNPQLEPRFRGEDSVYDKLTDLMNGDKFLADLLWETWKNCRNLVFHWFPDEKRAINFEESKDRVEQVIKAIDVSFKECKMNKHGENSPS